MWIISNVDYIHVLQSVDYIQFQVYNPHFEEYNPHYEVCNTGIHFEVQNVYNLHFVFEVYKL